MTKEENYWTEFLVQQRLIWFLQSMTYIVPNMRTYMYANIYEFEMDLFFLRPSGYAEEIEIKVTLSDFKADKKKTYKHDLYKRAYQGDGAAQKKVAPNRFSYAVPEFLGITLTDLPEYAGLYVLKNNGRVIREKWPEFLHKYKRNWGKKVANSTAQRLLYAKGYYKR